MKRKDFLKTSIILTGGLPFLGCLNEQTQTGNLESSWNAGDVSHILPTVNHERMLVTTSFKRPINQPTLKVGQAIVKGQKRDSKGYFWIFDCDRLFPSTAYELRLFDNKEPLCDAWELKTFPAPEADASNLRLMIYTCAGGHPLAQELLPIPEDEKESPAHYAEKRVRLLNRGLSFKPDALIVIGDTVYWDLSGNGKTRLGTSDLPQAHEIAGKFNPDQPILGTENEEVLKKAVSPQIIDLYGTACRSTPVFFFNDDHDYFENDEANDALVTFPPKPFQLNLGRTVQSMYYPEFLPEIGRPRDLPGSAANDRVPGASETFGSLRYGKLAELLMYDCRRFVSLAGADAVFLPQSTEKWLIDRTNSKDVLHTIHLPSTPYGWSAGKWLEWYPDILGKDKKLTDQIPKYLWQQGWQNQHNRILAAMSQNKAKKAITISGDLHAFGAGQIHRIGEQDLSANPIYSFLAGPLSATVFPSTFRKIKASVPVSLSNEEYFENEEENGFSIVDIDANTVNIKMYKYLFSRDDLNLIDGLLPFQDLKVKRSS